MRVRGPIRIGIVRQVAVILSAAWRSGRSRGICGCFSRVPSATKMGAPGPSHLGTWDSTTSFFRAGILSAAWRAVAPRGVEGPAVAFSRRIPDRILVLGLFFAAIAPAQQPNPSAPVVLDRVVAVVNKHAILASDIDDEIRLSVLDPNLVGEGALTPPRALDQLINRALIEQQIREQDMQAIAPSQDEVNTRLEQIRGQLPACVRENCATDAGWKAFLAAHGLTPERVESYLRYRLEILSFIEQRFRQGIQISPQQIQSYYHDILLPQYAPGETVPPLDQVAPRIQEILLEKQVNVLFDAWLKNLREQGDVEVLDPSLESDTTENSSPVANPDASAVGAPAANTGASPGERE
jgi:peptidyl-prolyl cis-trans isomerase SurA